MNDTNKKLGFTILNSDFKFEAKNVYIELDWLFIITYNNEILVFIFNEDQFSKKYALLTNPQVREQFIDLYVLDKLNILLEHKHEITKVLLTLTSNFIFQYWNLESGLCYSKINLSKFFEKTIFNINNNSMLIFGNYYTINLMDNPEFSHHNNFRENFYRNLDPISEVLIISKNIYNRFILIFTSKKYVIYDSFTQTIAKTDLFSFCNKLNVNDNQISKVLMVKDNAFFLLTENNTSYLFLLDMSIFYNNDYNINFNVGLNNLNSYFNTNYNLIKVEFLKTSISFNNYSGLNNRLNIANYSFKNYNIDNNFYCCVIKNKNFNYIERIKKFKDNCNQINIDYNKKMYFLNCQVLIFSEKNTLYYSYLNSINDINIIASRNLSFSYIKNIVIYIGEIYISNIDYIIVIYKNLSLDILFYDINMQELKLVRKIKLMIDNSIINYNVVVKKNIIIVYSYNQILTFKILNEDIGIATDKDNLDLGILFDDDYKKESSNEYVLLYNRLVNILNLTLLNNKQKNSLYKLYDKYNDNFLDLNDCFNKKIYFTNYFKENFSLYKSNLISDLNIKNKSLKDNNNTKKNQNNKSNNDNLNKINNSLTKIERKNSITNLRYFNSRQLHKFNISCSILFVNKEDFTFYYIIGLDNGNIYIIDIFFNNNFKLNPIFRILYHNRKINFLTVYNNKVLIACSESGLISFTDISKRVLKTYSNIENTDKEDIIIENNINDLNKINCNNICINKDKLLDKNRLDTKSDIQNKNKVVYIDICPYFNYRSFYNIRKIFYVVQIEYGKIDYNNYSNNSTKKHNNGYIGFIYLNNQVDIFDLNSTTKLYSLISNTIDIIGIYIHPINKVLMFLLQNFKLKICSYLNKCYERIISDHEKIFSILKINAKFKVFFNNTNNILINNFIVENNNKKDIYINDKFNVPCNTININLNNCDDKDLKEFSLENFHYNTYKKKVNVILNKDLIYPTKSINKINNKNNNLALDENFNFNNYIENIRKELLESNTNTQINNRENFEFNNNNNYIEDIDSLYKTQFLYNLMMKKKLKLNITQNKFDLLNAKMVENYIVDKVYNVINNSNINRYLKKIIIFNLINFPDVPFLNKIEKLYQTGIECEYIIFGKQLNQSICFNFSDLFYFIERIINELKNTKMFLNSKHNIYNILSLFRIWNLSLEQDLLINKIFKIIFPIFDFNLILYGVDCSSTIMLNEEDEISGNDTFKNHYKLFFNRSNNINDKDLSNNLKLKEKIMNKKNNVYNEKGYLINLKNFKINNNVSYLLNLLYFGNLISFLGYDDEKNIPKLMTNDKMLFRSLSIQRFIKFTDLINISSQMFEHYDSISVTNKDIIFVDYLLMKINKKKPISKIKSDSKKIDDTLKKTSVLNISRDCRKKSTLKLFNLPLYSKFNNSFIYDGTLNSFYSFDIILRNIFIYINKLYNIVLLDLIKDSNIKIIPELDNIPTKTYKNITHNNLSQIILSKNSDKYINEKHLTEFELLLVTIIINYNSLNSNVISEDILNKSTQILIVFVFKIINDPEKKSKYSKLIIELILKSSTIFDKIFNEDSYNFLKLILGLYTSIKIPIDLEGLFKKFEIGNCLIIKSEDNLNFSKIMIAKILKSYCKTKVNIMLKYIIEEFEIVKESADIHNYLLEILWIIFKEKNAIYIQYLPSLVNLLMKYVVIFMIYKLYFFI